MRAKIFIYKIDQINNTDLRRRVAQKVSHHKAQPTTQQNMIGKAKYESLYHKNTTTMKALSEYRLPMARPQTCYSKIDFLGIVILINIKKNFCIILHNLSSFRIIVISRIWKFLGLLKI